MSEHAEQAAVELPTPLTPGALSGTLRGAGLALGVIGLGGAFVWSRTVEHGTERLVFGYFTAWTFALTVSLGALFFVLLQHVTRAGWSVTARRLAEVLAANFPVLILLFLPLLLGLDKLFAWVLPDSHDAVLAAKVKWLNVPFFLARVGMYLLVWAGMGWYYLRRSVQQDASGDPGITLALQRWSAPGLVVFALTGNFAAFDLLMSLDPHWYSTIFGVYVFSGSVIAATAALIVILRGVQRAGLLNDPRLVHVEHYHDLGKLLFAFVFFWGYIAFSQYMLIWYANLPEETGWFARRGATTATGGANAYSWMILSLLVLHFLVPFAGLLSRVVKRRYAALLFWALLLLAMHVVDLYWLIRPELRGHDGGPGTASVPLALEDIGILALCLAGVGGLYLAGAVTMLGRASLVPMRDPRLNEAVTFHQAF